MAVAGQAHSEDIVLARLRGIYNEVDEALQAARDASDAQRQNPHSIFEPQGQYPTPASTAGVDLSRTQLNARLRHIVQNSLFSQIDVDSYLQVLDLGITASAMASIPESLIPWN
ncbi:hypothetical protein C8J57DRAFT_1230662 [Mycena rebaudengoi]|nr:hypothetical protein C8J57DRAFT_1230662 [Mycena rebaudengoi]